MFICDCYLLVIGEQEAAMAGPGQQLGGSRWYMGALSRAAEQLVSAVAGARGQ